MRGVADSASPLIGCQNALWLLSVVTECLEVPWKVPLQPLTSPQVTAVICDAHKAAAWVRASGKVWRVTAYRKFQNHPFFYI